MWSLLLACISPAVVAPVAPPEPREAAGWGPVGLRPPPEAPRGTVVSLGLPVAELPADVAVIDVPVDRLRDRPGTPCRDYSADLSALIATVLPDGAPPPVVLAGADDGAAMAWVALAQGARGAWGGMVGAGFCPDLPTETPICPAPRWTPSDGPVVELPPLFGLDPGRIVVVRACVGAVGWLGNMGPAVRNAPTARAGIDQLLRRFSATTAGEPQR